MFIPYDSGPGKGCVLRVLELPVGRLETEALGEAGHGESATDPYRCLQ